MGAHESLVRVHREMHQAAAKLEQRLLGVTVGAVLANGVLHVLACPRVLEFQRRHRQAVHEQGHVHRLEGVHLAVMHLPGHAEAVGLEVGCYLRVEVVVGQPIEQIEVGIVNVQPFLQHGQHAVFLDLLVQPLQHQPLPVRPVFQLRQFLGLGGFEEIPKELAVNSELPVKVSRIANAIAVLRKSDFDMRFKCGFVGLADHVVPLDLKLPGNDISD